MNFRLLIPVVLAAAVLTAACDTTSEARRKERKPRYGYQGEESSTTTETLPPKPSSPSPSSSSSASADSDSEPAPPPPPMNPSNQAAAGTVKSAPPYAIKVPDKPGYVTSPRAPYAGVIDVRGYAPGTEIRDPWSPGQTLLVP